MSWIVKRPKQKKIHLCKQPRIWWWIKVGALWQCDECEKIWIVKTFRDPSSIGGDLFWHLEDSRNNAQRDEAAIEVWLANNPHLFVPPEYCEDPFCVCKKELGNERS